MDLFSKSAATKPSKPKAQINPFAGKPCLGIDLGSRALKLACGRANPVGILLDSLGIAVDNLNASEHGKITNIAFITDMIKQTTNQFRMLSKNMIGTVESINIISRELTLPNLDDEAMPGAVSFEMQQYLPIDPAAYVMEYKRLETTPEGQAKVWVVAMPRTIIEPYVKIFEELDSRIFAMDTNSNAFSKLVTLEMATAGAAMFAGKTVMVVDMGHSYMNAMFFQNGKFLFNRILTMGSVMLNQMIMRTMNVPELEAEGIKLGNNRDYSLLDIVRRATELQSHQQKSVPEQVLYDSYIIMNNWFYELENVIKYHTTRDRDNTVDAVYLYGGCSKIREIDTYLTKRLSIETRVIRDMQSVRFANPQSHTDISLHINAISALIRN